jgi:hypothetical protein
MKDDTPITPLRQSGSILDPLTGIARDGARQMRPGPRRRASLHGSRTNACLTAGSASSGMGPGRNG